MAGLVTVFGGSGFVGRAVVRALCRRGWRVRVAVRRPHVALSIKLAGDVGQVQLVGANVRDDRSVADALAGADACVNLVGVLHESGGQTFEALQAEGADRVARAAAAGGITRFVQMSAIGAGPASRSAYAVTKARGEQAAREHLRTATIIRPSIVFGPEDSFFNRFAAMAVMSPALPLIDGGTTRMQPVYVADVARAIALAVDDPSFAGRTFELGGPQVLTFRELMERTLTEIGRRRALLPLPAFAARPMGQLFQTIARFLPITPPLTGDQVDMLAVDNVVRPGSDGLEAFGIAPTGIDAVIPSYLYRYRPRGQFSPAPTALPASGQG